MKAEVLDNTQLYKGSFGPKAHMHLSWKATEWAELREFILLLKLGYLLNQANK